MRRGRLQCVSVVALALGLGACSDVDSLRRHGPLPAGFTGSLAAEYLAYAESEQEQKEWRLADRFAAKGLAAAKGHPPAPDAPESFALPGDEGRLLADAHQRLAAALNDETKQALPAELARAQLLYDCWLSQVADRHQGAGEAACGAEFEAAMALIERDAPREGAMHEVRHVAVPFASGNAKLSPAAAKRLTGLVTRAKKLGNYRIHVTGYADATGPDADRRTLARDRASATRDALVALGAQPKRIIVRSGGVLSPVEIGQAEPAQPLRRAEVMLCVLRR